LQGKKCPTIVHLHKGTVMKIYVHEGHGLYVGSTVAVIAESKERAIDLICKELEEWGIEEPLNIREVDIIPDTIFITDNGDY